MFSRDRANAAWLAGFLGLLLAYPAAYAARFIDMSGNWAERPVNKLSDRGVIPAEKDGKFKPDDTVTRAVFASWLVKVLGFDNVKAPAKPSFKDVKPTDWYYKAVETLAQKRYMAAYPDGFRPNQTITKGEMILIVSRALPGSAPDQSAIDQTLAKYRDGSKVADWVKPGLVKVAQANILVNYPHANEIDSDGLATRASAAGILYKLQEYFYKQDIDEKVAEAEQAQSGKGSSYDSGGNSQPPAAYGGATQPPTAYGGGGYGGQDSQQPAAAADGSGGGPDQAFSAGGSYGAQGSQYPSEPTAFAGQAPAYQPPAGGYGGGPPASGYGAPPAYQGQQPGYADDAPVYQGQVVKSGAPGAYLQGGATVVEAGTHFRATLNNTLSSATHQVGQEFTATVSEPLLSGGSEVIPVGSKLIGQVTNVVPAKSFRFSANGKIDVKFTAVELPDGRRFPLQATIDAKELKEAAGVTGNSMTSSARKATGGAMKGMKFGGMAGGIYGAARGGGSMSNMMRGAGQGAMVGTLLGATGGLVGAAVQKGSDVKVPAGLSLPIKLDSALQMQNMQGSAPSRQLMGGPQYAAPPQFGEYPIPLQGGNTQSLFGGQPMRQAPQPFGYHGGQGF